MNCSHKIPILLLSPAHVYLIYVYSSLKTNVYLSRREHWAQAKLGYP